MDITSLSTILLALIALILVLILPGAVWLLWARPPRGDVLEWLLEAAASSLSLTALLGMLLSLLGIRLTAFSLASLYGLLLLGWVAVKVWQGRRIRLRAQNLLMIGALLGFIAWRLYQARALVLPAWVDSVHHTLLVRLMLERGGVPGDWLPYLPVEMFYHYGFHISAAVFSFFSRIDPPQAVLVFGQVLNALVSLAVYRLGKALFRDVKRAAIASLLVGFAFLMPGYYVSWGRYTLLTGLIVLSAAVAAALDVQRAPASRNAWARLALYSCGVCFCHFLAVGLLALFLLVMAVFALVKAARSRTWKAFTWQPFAAAAAGALAASPWLGRVWYYNSQSFSVNLANPFDPTQAQAAQGLLDYLLYLVGPWRGHVLLLLAGVGVLLAIKKPGLRLLAVWMLLMTWLATPWGLRFEPFRPDHLAIVLFLPASLLCAEVLAGASEALSKVWRKEAGTVGLVLAAGGLLLWGLIDSRDVLNPVTNFITADDTSALAWIERNTSPAARFYVNTTPWQWMLYRGVDGGYWIAPATGRATLLPPAAYGWGSRQYIDAMTETMKRATQVTGCSEDFWALVNENYLTHIYLRELAGSLQPEGLAGCAGIQPIYKQGRVWIYEIEPNK